MNDAELIAAVAGGDDAALRELFGRHAPWLAARLRSVLSATDVEPVLQETFLAVWRGARGYRPDGPAGGWIWGIARRQAALFLRRRGPAALVLPAVIAADGRHAEDPADAALSRADLAGAVAALGPEDSPDRRVWQLMSGGMLRRVGIAQAIVNEPELLLLDEPTAGLDPEQRVTFRALLRDLGQRATVIVSTHLVEDVGAACTEVALMDAGKIVFHGTPTELTARGEGRGTGDAPLERGYSAVLAQARS
jgi:DNA-directed RNA polymerase specialized sigma24 family protein